MVPVLNAGKTKGNDRECCWLDLSLRCSSESASGTAGDKCLRDDYYGITCSSCIIDLSSSLGSTQNASSSYTERM